MGFQPSTVGIPTSLNNSGTLGVDDFPNFPRGTCDRSLEGKPFFFPCFFCWEFEAMAGLRSPLAWRRPPAHLLDPLMVEHVGKHNGLHSTKPGKTGLSFVGCWKFIVIQCFTYFAGFFRPIILWESNGLHPQCHPRKSRVLVKELLSQHHDF